MKICPVILCGGAGTRLWPKSKKNVPKQFIDWDGWTLFDKTLERLRTPIFDYPIITTNYSYLKLVKKHLSRHKIKKYKIILEPFKKNTAPAILASALIKEIPYNQPMVFFTSDNLMGKINLFNNSIYRNQKNLTKDNIFIFGIKPTSPSSEYGYFLTKKMKNNINRVTQFIEKPNSVKAKIIVNKKGYMNAGMFYARKDSLISNFKKHQLKNYNYCVDSVNKAKIRKNVYYLNKSSFKKLKEISFDYAILEKAKNINGIKLNIPLTDLGNWKVIWKFFKNKRSKNYIKRNTVIRPWGSYTNLFSGKGFLLKELIIKPKSAISLQKHFHRSERWTVISGNPKITVNKNINFKKPNDTVFVPKEAIHRIENPSSKAVKIAEVQIGSILKENDILRYKDFYNRN
jgi:mannose-1-phosphate guanylyltransferase/mannose-6-phosphate isomerase